MTIHYVCNVGNLFVNWVWPKCLWNGVLSFVYTRKPCFFFKYPKQIKKWTNSFFYKSCFLYCKLITWFSIGCGFGF